MTAKQILDSFSETLMQDDRIVSPREREFLVSLLQNSRAVSSHNPELQSAVSEAIARSVGETVAQRAFTLLGRSVMEQVSSQSNPDFAGGESRSFPNIFFSNAPLPPKPKEPKPPSEPPQPERDEPLPPGPQPPLIFRRQSVFGTNGCHQTQSHESSGVGVLEAPEGSQSCVILDEFLAPQEAEELMQFTLLHEAEFQNSEVIAPSGEAGIVDFTHRRSRVLADTGKHGQVILDRIERALPSVLRELGMESFPVTATEAQITASNDGDFFRAHSDNSQESIASRRLTFVYFFNHEPRRFDGGELRIYHSTRQSGDSANSRVGDYRSIAPQQNQIVFFPCSLLHEITPIKCSSQAFADGRFTINGWLHN